MKCSVFIATSLDGFIARPDGGIDWLLEATATAPKGEDFGYAAFAATVDALVMGRLSFEQALGFEAWPYGDMRVVVLSSRGVQVPEHLQGTVETTAEAPADLVQRLQGQGLRHLYIDGGVTIQRFLAAGLIDEMTVTLIPVLLGEGRPLFGPIGRDVALEHVASRSFANGFVQLVYGVAG